MSKSLPISKPTGGLLIALLLYAAACGYTHAATAKITVTSAAWSVKTGLLSVKGKLSNTTTNTVDIYDSSGRLLATTTADAKHAFALQIPDDRPELLCNISVKSVGTATTKAVAGANKDCTKLPVCKIVNPSSGSLISVNKDVTFTASASLKVKNAGPLSLEWDFSGGVMGELIPGSNPPAYKRPTGLSTQVQFVRNNARYQVHFSASDTANRRCEDTITVSVGNPPTDLPNVSALVNAAQQNAPKRGSQLAGKAGDVVVLPFADMTMQAHSDARYTPNLYVAATPGSFNTLNAHAYTKARQPVQLTGDEISLRYSAATNKADPVGGASINSTSQNWPLGAVNESAPFASAGVQKSDMWERLVRPATAMLADDYMSMSWMDGFVGGAVVPDEGFKVDASLFPSSHGSYMPGFGKPFMANAYQNFTNYTNADHTHIARNLPVTDIDDSGRVNPYPLMRIQAVDKKTQQVIANATTDTVLAVGKDFHCSECHAKGKIAANPALDFSPFTKAYHSSSEYNSGYHCPTSVCNDKFTAPVFYDAVDQNGKPSDNLADQEYAAVKNANALHDFYDNIGMVWWMENGVRDAPQDGGLFHMDMIANCTWCHASMINPLQQIGYPGAFTTNTGKKAGDMMFYPSYSEAMHKFHAQIQLDPSNKTRILREASGRPLRWDESKGANPNSLFPTVSAKGESLPMEQSCLRCHSGHREQLYRDRMYTAGTTCHDCHGDMLAVGKAYNKPKPGPEGDATRVEWLDQPDCGSCHMGNGNLGKSGTGKGGTSEAYSAGVMRRAFDSADKSATARKPLLQRFAVQAGITTQIPKDDWVDPEYSTRHSTLSLSKPLYRKSRDSHGDVACGACHGGAHEVWPNRDPNANDNVTALQLQGHTGTISECKVCHTADSFKNELDLDGGRFMTDVGVDSGVLGGPHNMHPVNDPYWWKSSQDSKDVNTIDTTTYGGWHNNYAKKPGKDGEDQCAACHGNDHKGTRLSKTPVDRVFDFTGFDLNKLKKAGIKTKVIKVAAGTPIACDTCHSIKTSCVGSPAGGQCGVASEAAAIPSNHDPVITSTPVLTGVLGVPYSYQIKATDADGDTLTFSLGLKHSSMAIDTKGLITTTWPESTFADYKSGPFTFPYSVNVSDGKGGYTTQNVTMTLECPAGKAWQWAGGQWDVGMGSCVAKTSVSITSTPSVLGINTGSAYSYQAVASDSKNLPITYSLGYAPDGVTINPNTGLVNWTAKTVSYGQMWFQVKATNSAGDFDLQYVTVTICVPNKNWDAAMKMCM